MVFEGIIRLGFRFWSAVNLGADFALELFGGNTIG
jgi:hypothetical protein